MVAAYDFPWKVKKVVLTPASTLALTLASAFWAIFPTLASTLALTLVYIRPECPRLGK